MKILLNHHVNPPSFQILILENEGISERLLSILYVWIIYDMKIYTHKNILKSANKETYHAHSFSHVYISKR